MLNCYTLFTLLYLLYFECDFKSCKPLRGLLYWNGKPVADRNVHVPRLRGVRVSSVSRVLISASLDAVVSQWPWTMTLPFWPRR